MQHFLSYIQNKLESIYQECEISAITKLLLRQLAGLSNVQIYCNKDIKIPDETRKELNAAVDRLSCNEPIQYILGETEFFGLPFKVKPGVLIPRPETEELVELVMKDSKSQDSVRILDIGTGSGCIAISLAKNIPNSGVSAWDISSLALIIAKENANLNQVHIDFRELNILNFEPTELEKGTIDIIISNPPYVCQSEKREMEAHVLNYEPHLALFVEDEDPLLFYKTITNLATTLLKTGGKLYFEINSNLGPETINLIREYPFREVELFKDISGRDRIIRALK